MSLTSYRAAPPRGNRDRAGTSVRHTLPLLRSNNKTPRRLSNCEMQRLKVDSLTPSCSTAPKTELLDNSRKYFAGNDGQFADPMTGGVKDGVGDGRGHTDGSNHADPLDAVACRIAVALLDEADVDRGHVSVHGHQIARQTPGGGGACDGILLDPLVKRHADAEDHAADKLAVCKFFIENAAGGVCAGQPGQPHTSQRGVDTHLRTAD